MGRGIEEQSVVYVGVRGDDYLVLGVCYVEGGEEGNGFEDTAEESGRGRYDVIRNNAMNGYPTFFFGELLTLLNSISITACKVRPIKPCKVCFA